MLPGIRSITEHKVKDKCADYDEHIENVHPMAEEQFAERHKGYVKILALYSGETEILAFHSSKNDIKRHCLPVKKTY